MSTNTMTPLGLHQLGDGDRGIVLDNPCRSVGAARLAELGLSSGNEVEVIRGGSPMLLIVGQSRLCLRTEDASQISVLPT